MGVIPVIGGGDAPPGAWPDVAALRDGQARLLCTGTLIAANVVVTAGHCDRTDLVDVLIGGVPLDHPELGEVIPVMAKFAYPSSQDSEDVAVLVLAGPSSHAPRAIASGWDVMNGAPVRLVGYGATDSGGTVFVPALQEAATTITDFACSTSRGCNALAMPDGELGAGGLGIDTCVGDSGGPLYLGGALAGITSRGYTGETALCGMGSIYARADRLVGWIEQVTGATIAHGAAPVAAAIATSRGTTGTTVIAANAPGAASFAIGVAPQSGAAVVGSDGTVRVCPDPGFTGDDSVTVSIRDGVHGVHGAVRGVAIAIPIHVADGPAATCSLDDGGCCNSGRDAGGAIPLAVVALLALRRRC